MAAPYKIRLVHQGTTDDYYVLADIDSANTSDDPFDFYYHQGHYLPRYWTRFVNGEVVVDTSTLGFVDLVLSDKVRLSREEGVIKGLEDQGLISVVEVQPGDLDAPSISTAEFDAASVGTNANDGDVELTGTGFLSTSPFTSSITITDDSGSQSITLSPSDVTGDGGTFSDTSIIVKATSHNLGTATGDVENVQVTADNQTDSSAVTEV